MIRTTGVRVPRLLIAVLGLLLWAAPNASAGEVQRFTFPASGYFGNFNVCTQEIFTAEGEVALTMVTSVTPNGYQFTLHQVAKGVSAVSESGTRY